MQDEIAQFNLLLKRRFGSRSTPKHYVNGLVLFVVIVHPPGDRGGLSSTQLVSLWEDLLAGGERLLFVNHAGDTRTAAHDVNSFVGA